MSAGGRPVDRVQQGTDRFGRAANRWLADMRKSVRILHYDGPHGMLAVARLTKTRRSHEDPPVPPDSPLGWAATVREIRLHYALDYSSPIVWSEAETRRDVRRISALSLPETMGQVGPRVRIREARQIRQVLATVEALRSWPATRQLPIEVEVESGVDTPWGSLRSIAGLTLVQNVPTSAATPDVQSSVLAVTAGQVPLPNWGKSREQEGDERRGYGSRLLVLSPHVPDVKRGSGSQDMYWFASHAASLGYDVLFVPTSPKSGDVSPRWELRNSGVRVVSGELTQRQIYAALPKAIAKSDLVAAFDKDLAILTRQLVTGLDRPPRLLFIPLDLKQFPQRVLVEQNLEAELHVYGLHVPTPDSVSLLAEAENEAIRASDLTALISTAEIDSLATADFASKLVHLPMLRSEMRWVAKSSNRPRLVFVAGFQHPPNYLAVGWFLDHVWPKIRQESPHLEFEIYGADLSPVWERDWSKQPGVVVRGPYEAEHEPYAGDTIAVAPLRYGGGTKGKVVGAIGHGAVVVGTSFASQGLPKDVQDAILVADSEDDMVLGVLELAHNSSLRVELRRQGRQAFSETFSVRAGRDHVRSCLRMVEELTPPGSEFGTG